MPFVVPLDDAKALYPEYNFINALTPSAQKASFHVQDEIGRDLCLKIISPKYQIDRLQREILALQNIEHENVAELVEYVQKTKQGEQKHHIIEEFINGYDLDEYINKQSPNLGETLKLFGGIFEGLVKAHELEIVHRDLKPGNIRVTQDGTPVIIDFGLARHLNLPSLTKTEHGAKIGTPKYFSPEQITGNKYDIDPRTDIFCLGIVAYEFIVGQHPFTKKGETTEQLYDRVVNSNECFGVEEFLELPKLVQLLLKKMLKKTKIERFNSIDKASRLLSKIQEK